MAEGNVLLNERQGHLSGQSSIAQTEPLCISVVWKRYKNGGRSWRKKKYLGFSYCPNPRELLTFALWLSIECLRQILWADHRPKRYTGQPKVNRMTDWRKNGSSLQESGKSGLERKVDSGPILSGTIGTMENASRRAPEKNIKEIHRSNGSRQSCKLDLVHWTITRKTISTGNSGKCKTSSAADVVEAIVNDARDSPFLTWTARSSSNASSGARNQADFSIKSAENAQHCAI
ncbi:hypothetical protein C8J56DRAFT_1033021 [Mycena floridula]|nr:hypothetical protein C8J56DRAFT_1033021 [Mycena floridula]